MAQPRAAGTEHLAPRTAGHRWSRRRLLTSAGALGVGLAGAALVGCGTGGEQAGATRTPVTVSVPKRGGTWHLALTADPGSLDPHASTSVVTKAVAAASYSRLFAYASGIATPRVTFDTVPDVATGIETTDGQTYTVTLDPNARFTAPVSRPVDADDVRLSFDRYLGRTRVTVAGADQELVSMIERVESPDPQTAVFHLTQPYAAFAQVLADPRTLQLLPAEAGRDFDPAQTMVGSGPWTLREFRPDTAVSFARNPEWHLGPDLPYFDALEMHIVSDAAEALTHFLGGTLDALALSAGDVERVLEAVPGVQVVSNDVSSINNITFSAVEPDAPWRDVRVRRAVSMALDRGAMLESVFGLQELTALGVEAPGHWNGFVPWGITEYWLDPKRMEPENAVAFEYDPAEAAKLMAAAGLTEPVVAEWHHTSGYRGAYPAFAEMVPEYLAAVGIEATPIVEDFSSVFLPQTFIGDFRGLASVAYGLGEPGNYLEALYTPSSVRNTGKVDDPALTEMVQAVQTNLDRDERRQQILDAQEYLATHMYNVPLPLGPSFTAYQPQARNVMTYQTHGPASAVDRVPWWWKD
ncbi:MAG: ABC transporter substrate-binding protein [Dehalococcoidia bacterium]